MPLLETRGSGSAFAYGLNSYQNYNIVTSGLLLNLDAGISSSYGGQNLLLQSEAPATSPWSKIGGAAVTVTNNAATDPLGGFTAATVTQAGGVGGESIVQNVSAFGNETYLLSVYVKAPSTGASPNFTFAAFFTGNSTVGNSAAWNPTDGSLVGGNPTSVEDAGNGWRRYTIQIAGTNASNNNLVWQIYTSVGTIQVWGGQLRRVSQNPSSGYVKTTTSQVTLNSTTWFDISGNNFHGTLVGSPAYTVSPGYFTFNTAKENTKYVSFSDNASVDFINKSPYTLETWAYITAPAGPGNYPGFMNHESGTPSRDGWNLYYTDVDSNTTSFSHERFVQGSADRGEYAEANITALNRWKHIVATFDGTSISYYVDGIRRSNVVIALGNITNTTVLLTGADRGGQRLDGRQSVIRIYNRALSVPEVAQNFNAIKGRYGI